VGIVVPTARPVHRRARSAAGALAAPGLLQVTVALTPERALGGNIAVGDTVVLEVTWKGTQNGPLETPGGIIPPSGKQWTVQAAQVIKIQNGKIKEFRQYFDLLTLLQQIGAAPAQQGARRA